MSVPFRFDLKIRGFSRKLNILLICIGLKYLKILWYYFDRELFFALAVQGIALFFLVRFIFYSLWIYFFLQAWVKVHSKNGS